MLPEHGHPDRLTIYANMIPDPDPAVANHLATCPRCQSIAQERERRRQAFHAHGPTPEEFAKKIFKMAAEEEAEERARRRKYGIRIAGGALAAAAAVLLVLGVVSADRHRHSGDADLTHRGSPITFKLVRVRNGEQTRHMDPVGARNGDEFIVELGLSVATRLTAGMLTDKKEWVPLFENRLLEAGTHRSEDVLFVKDGVDPGWIVVGPPNLMRQVVDQKRSDIAGVLATRVYREEQGKKDGAP